MKRRWLKTKKANVWQHFTIAESQDILQKIVGGSLGGASSSADAKPVARRIENSEPIIFDLRERDDELEDQGIRVIRFYIGDDEDEPVIQEVEELTFQTMNP